MPFDCWSATCPTAWRSRKSCRVLSAAAIGIVSIWNWNWTSTPTEPSTRTNALDATIETVKCVGESLSRIRSGAHSPMNADETLATLSLLGQVVTHCVVTQRVLVDMAEQRKKRKLRLAK